MQIWFAIFVSCPEPAGPRRLAIFVYTAMTGSALPQVRIAAHAAEHDLLALGRPAGRGGGGAAILGHPLRGLRRIAVVDSNVMAGLFQMTRHRIAHYAQADECDFHCYSTTSILGV